MNDRIQISTTENRSKRLQALEEGRRRLTLAAREDKRKGFSNVAIANRLGVAESTVRRLLGEY